MSGLPFPAPLIELPLFFPMQFLPHDVYSGKDCGMDATFCLSLYFLGS